MRRLQQRQHPEAREAFALCGRSKLNALLEPAGVPAPHQLRWLLLGFSDADVQSLLKNRLLSHALDALLLLGDAEQAHSIVRAHKQTLRNCRPQLESLASLCRERRLTRLFVETQALLGDKAAQVDYFVRNAMGARLFSFVRQTDFGADEQHLLRSALEYFEAEGDWRGCWEVLLRLKDAPGLLRCALRTRNFAGALKLVKESGTALESPDLAVPLAEHLVVAHRFAEAADLLQRVDREALLKSLLQGYVKLQFAQGKFARVAKAFRFLFGTERSKTGGQPQRWLVDLLVFFGVLTNVQSEVAEMQSALAQLPDARWRASFGEYFAKEGFSVGNASYSRADSLRLRIRFLQGSSTLLRSRTFRVISDTLARYAELVASVCAAKLTPGTETLSPPSGKENAPRSLGSRRSFKRVFRKQQPSQSALACFLCSTVQTGGSLAQCSQCKVPLRMCVVSGVPVPLVEFAVDSEAGETCFLDSL